MLHDSREALRLSPDDVQIVAVLPDRPNIFLDVRHQDSYDAEEDLKWIAEGLKEQQQQYPKTLVFAQTIRQVVDIYEDLKTSLECHAYMSEERAPEKRLISMYHGEIAPALQNYTLDNFRDKDSILRVLVSTIAFGMGVEIQGIKTVVHYGKTKSMLCYWQVVGRCGRDGAPAAAIWYPKSTAGDDHDVFKKIKSDKSVYMCPQDLFGKLCVTRNGHFIPGVNGPVRPREFVLML